jgi:hypothetical protein
MKFFTREKHAVNAKVPTVAMADVLARLAWCEKQIIRLESNEVDRYRALELRIEELEARL